MPVSLSTKVPQQFPANLHDCNHVTIAVRLLLWWSGDTVSREAENEQEDKSVVFCTRRKVLVVFPEQTPSHQEQTILLFFRCKTVCWANVPGHMVLWGSSSPQVLNLCWTQVVLWPEPDSSLQHRTLQTCGFNVQQREASNSLFNCVSYWTGIKTNVINAQNKYDSQLTTACSSWTSKWQDTTAVSQELVP